MPAYVLGVMILATASVAVVNDLVPPRLTYLSRAVSVALNDGLQQDYLNGDPREFVRRNHAHRDLCTPSKACVNNLEVVRSTSARKTDDSQHVKSASEGSCSTKSCCATIQRYFER